MGWGRGRREEEEGKNRMGHVPQCLTFLGQPLYTVHMNTFSCSV